MSDDKTRFLSYVEKGECWLWKGGIARQSGYGRFWYQGKTLLAHRVAYMLFKGELLDEDTIDHLCRVRHCVNPDHLEAVPIAVNLRRAFATKTHCPKGHEYTPDNTYVDKNNCRTCKACRALCQREYMRKKKEASL